MIPSSSFLSHRAPTQNCLKSCRPAGRWVHNLYVRVVRPESQTGSVSPVLDRDLIAVEGVLGDVRRSVCVVSD